MSKKNKKRKKVALVLGGGGARCFAHLGIIEVLQKNNIEIDCIASSSMGSIIAALIANNVKINDIKKEFYKFTNRVKWLTPTIPTHGFLSQSNIKNILNNLLKNKKIENSTIKLYIVATNLNTGKLKVFEKGNIIKAVSASAAFPGIYQPVKIGQYYYVDGGVLNNIPADICKNKINKDTIIISSKLEGKFSNYHDYKNNPFSVIWRSIYIPIIENREKIVIANSDLILDPLKDTEFSFRNWKDILKFYNKDLMEEFYQKGKKEMLNNLDKLNNLLKE